MPSLSIREWSTIEMRIVDVIRLSFYLISVFSLVCGKSLPDGNICVIESSSIEICYVSKPQRIT